MFYQAGFVNLRCAPDTEWRLSLYVPFVGRLFLNALETTSLSLLLETSCLPTSCYCIVSIPRSLLIWFFFFFFFFLFLVSNSHETSQGICDESLEEFAKLSLLFLFYEFSLISNVKYNWIFSNLRKLWNLKGIKFSNIELLFKIFL